MRCIYHVDADIRTPKGEVMRDYHLETPNQAEAESEFIRCWFSKAFWDVRIWKEWKEDRKQDRGMTALEYSNAIASAIEDKVS